MLAKLSWYHHIALLDKVKDPNIRDFYIRQTIAKGWSRNVMVCQFINYNNHQPFLKKLYNQTFVLSDHQLLSDAVSKQILEGIESRVAFLDKSKSDCDSR